MGIDKKKVIRQEQAYPEVGKCIGKSETKTDALPSYKYLYALKSKIPKEVYAYYLRRILSYNTANVSVEFRLKMLESVEREDIMYQEELDAIQSFGDSITVYRGESKEEEKPGLSWSRKRYIAESGDFYQGRLFVATIPTSAILVYLSKDTDEEEIIAHVTENYEIEDEESFDIE